MLSKALQNKISKIIADLKKDPIYRNIHWTKIKNLHITLRFLGNIPIDQLLTIGNDIQPIIATIPAFKIALNSLVLFPKPEAPIALVLQPMPSNLELIKLALTIDTCVIQHGANIEKRAFSPHLTIARIKNKLANKNAEQSLACIKIPELILDVNEIQLMRSEPSPLDSNYKEIMSFRLKF